jgi:cytochrome P450
VFSPAAVRALRPAIEAAVEELAEMLPAGEPFDLMRAFADPLPKRVMAGVMGYPAADAGRLQQLFATIESVRSTAGGTGRFAQAMVARDQARTVVAGDDTGAATRGGVLGALMSGADRDGLEPDDVVSLAAHIGAVGTGPTAGAIGNAVVALAREPGLMGGLRAAPALARAAAHELMRYDSATHVVARFAIEDAELGGRRIRRGDGVLAVVGAANRDPATFTQPDVVDFRRDARRQLGFGQGEHICLGAPLARVITEAALTALLKRFSRIEPVGAPEYGTNFELRLPERLVVRAA